jgi:hypothetical protein
MVTAWASERGAGSEPTSVAAPRPPNSGNDCTVPTVTGDPPPKTNACPPDTAAAASCSGAVSLPIWRAAPVAVRTA